MNYNWDLKNIYKTEEDFEKDLKFLDEKVLPLISSVEGKLNTEAGMVTYCKCQLDLEKYLQPVYMYAACASDLDKRDLEANKRLGRVMILFQKIGNVSAYAEPELLKIGEEKVMKFFEEHKEGFSLFKKNCNPFMYLVYKYLYYLSFLIQPVV